MMSSSFSTTFPGSEFDDLVVVPTVSLNPKKAKKKMKKEFRKQDEAELRAQEERLATAAKPPPAPAPAAPVVPAAVENMAKFEAAPWRTSKPKAATPAAPAQAWKNWAAPVKPWAAQEDLSDTQSTSAGTDDDEVDGEASPRSSVGESEAAAKSSPNARLHLLVVPSGPKKSWFELTEEDDDDLIFMK